MCLIRQLAVERSIPERAAVLRQQGVPVNQPLRANVEQLIEQAYALFQKISSPTGILLEVSTKEFATIYHGEGDNEEQAPVGLIFPQASSLSLFAVTVGEAVSRRIQSLFDDDDFALAVMLDTVASAAVEKVADWFEAFFHKMLGDNQKECVTLRYSPGYCGWHISGQRCLFAHLQPEKIGISLRTSFLMEPLKSISGVLLAGPAEIHQVTNTYSCCEACVDPTCQERIAKVMSSKEW